MKGFCFTSLAVGWALAAILLPIAPAFAEGHEITGSVRYEGPPIERKALRMNADPKCEAMHAGKPVLNDAKLVDEEGRVANVFVYLKELPDGLGPFEAPEQPVELRQEGCMYTPKVLGIQLKQTLEVYNDDETLHNVRFLARANRPFNLGQPAKGKRTKFFTKLEKGVKFRCDVHPWMSSFLFILDHPFYTRTNEQGRFSIAGLPPGKYTFVAWHEDFGEIEFEAEAPGDAAISLTFE